MRYFYGAILILVMGVGGSLIHRTASIVQDITLPESQFGLLGSVSVPGEILFGGDIMLARSVESVMDEQGTSFPFFGIEELVSDADVAVANFEAAVPEVHQKTKSNTMRFSVTESALKEVARTGFDILSLSNNHTLDHGDAGYLNTKEVCTRVGVECLGHPVKHSTSSMTVVDVKGTNVGVLMLHTLFEAPSTTVLTDLIDTLEETSDVQFAFIHWGDEYERVHNIREEILAHFLIDEGIDAIIGHHPHVMQDIKLYRGKPIFYSLGNLIFDQYFSVDVQEGYFVRATFNKESITYTLVPYDSHDVRSQPRPQQDGPREKTLRTLLRYPLFSVEEIRKGAFQVLRDQ